MNGGAVRLDRSPLKDAMDCKVGIESAIRFTLVAMGEGGVDRYSMWLTFRKAVQLPPFACWAPDSIAFVIESSNRK